MIVFRKPSEAEHGRFLEAFRKQLGASEGNALEHLGITWEELASMFNTVGEVRSAYRDSECVGFVWIELRQPDLHIHAIVLFPEHRGQGIGRAVFDALEEEFKDAADRIELGVQDENRNAIDFYDHIGFSTVKQDTAPGFRILRKELSHSSGSESAST